MNNILSLFDKPYDPITPEMQASYEYGYSLGFDDGRKEALRGWVRTADRAPGPDTIISVAMLNENKDGWETSSHIPGGNIQEWHLYWFDEALPPLPPLQEDK